MRDVQGRVACELNAGDELVTTEVVFAGVLSELSPEEAAAVLAALVFQACPMFQAIHRVNDSLAVPQ